MFPVMFGCYYLAGEEHFGRRFRSKYSLRKEVANSVDSQGSMVQIAWYTSQGLRWLFRLLTSYVIAHLIPISLTVTGKLLLEEGPGKLD